MSKQQNEREWCKVYYDQDKPVTGDSYDLPVLGFTKENKGVMVSLDSSLLSDASPDKDSSDDKKDKTPNEAPCSKNKQDTDKAKVSDEIQGILKQNVSGKQYMMLNGAVVEVTPLKGSTLASKKITPLRKVVLSKFSPQQRKTTVAADKLKTFQLQKTVQQLEKRVPIRVVKEFELKTSRTVFDFAGKNPRFVTLPLKVNLQNSNGTQASPNVSKSIRIVGKNMQVLNKNEVKNNSEVGNELSISSVNVKNSNTVAPSDGSTLKVTETSKDRSFCNVATSTDSLETGEYPNGKSVCDAETSTDILGEYPSKKSFRDAHTSTDDFEMKKSVCSVETSTDSFLETLKVATLQNSASTTADLLDFQLENSRDPIIGQNVDLGFGFGTFMENDSLWDNQFERNTRTSSYVSRRPENQLKKKFLEDLKNCSSTGPSGNLPIHLAVMEGRINRVKQQCLLLKLSNISIDVKNNSGFTPLQLALLHDASQEIIVTLLDSRADFEILDHEGNSAIHLAVLHSTVQILEVLLKEMWKTTLDLFNYEGCTPLMLCVMENKLQMAHMLLKYGADPNVKDKKSGRTALFHAVEADNVKMVKLLLSCKADPKVRNFFGTSTHEAVFELDGIDKEISMMVLGKNASGKSKSKTPKKKKRKSDDGEQQQQQEKSTCENSNNKKPKFHIVKTLQKVYMNKNKTGK